MKLFKLLIVSIVVLHMVGALAVMSCTLQQPPQRAQRCAAAVADGVEAEPAFVVTRPQRKPVGAGTVAMLLVHTILIFAAGTWLICTALAPYDQACGAKVPSERSLAYLQEGTQGAGAFVILDHAVEDLEPLRPHELETALTQAREQDPALELREVAGRWILRRPRI